MVWTSLSAWPRSSPHVRAWLCPQLGHLYRRDQKSLAPGSWSEEVGAASVRRILDFDGCFAVVSWCLELSWNEEVSGALWDLRVLIGQRREGRNANKFAAYFVGVVLCVGRQFLGRWLFRGRWGFKDFYLVVVIRFKRQTTMVLVLPLGWPSSSWDLQLVQIIRYAKVLLLYKSFSLFVQDGVKRVKVNHDFDTSNLLWKVGVFLRIKLLCVFQSLLGFAHFDSIEFFEFNHLAFSYKAFNATGV